MTSKHEYFTYSCKFMLRGPIVSVCEVGKEAISKTSSPVRSVSAMKETPRKDIQKKDVKGKKPQTPDKVEVVQPVIAPLTVKNSKLLIEFG